MPFRLTPTKRLIIVIFISCTFCIVEFAIGFRTSSLAMIADGFHVTNDLIGFIIALAATVKVQQSESTKEMRTLSSLGRYTFGWERAEILGAFFNGVFLLALATSILLQAIERFLDPKPVDKPMSIIIVGSIGLGLNIISAFTVHDSGHAHGDCHKQGHRQGHENEPKPMSSNGLHHSSYGTSEVNQKQKCTYPSEERTTQASFSDVPMEKLHASHEHASLSRKKIRKGMDLNTFGVFIHLLGDAFNNLLVIVSAVVYMKTNFIYCDCIASACVGIMIFSTALPLVKHSGIILLDTAPEDIEIGLVVKDLQEAHNVDRVTSIHIWQLAPSKVQATVKIDLAEPSFRDFDVTCSNIRHYLESWGVHQVCIEPNFQSTSGKNTPGRLQERKSNIGNDIPHHHPVISSETKHLSLSETASDDFRSSPYHLPPIRPSKSAEAIVDFESPILEHLTVDLKKN